MRRDGRAHGAATAAQGEPPGDTGWATITAAGLEALRAAERYDLQQRHSPAPTSPLPPTETRS